MTTICPRYMFAAVSIKNPHKSKWASLAFLLKSCSRMKNLPSTSDSLDLHITWFQYRYADLLIDYHITYTMWSVHYFSHTDILFAGVEQAMKKWEGNLKNFCSCPGCPSTIPVCPHPSVAEPGGTAPKWGGWGQYALWAPTLTRVDRNGTIFRLH